MYSIVAMQNLEILGFSCSEILVFLETNLRF